MTRSFKIYGRSRRREKESKRIDKVIKELGGIWALGHSTKTDLTYTLISPHHRYPIHPDLQLHGGTRRRIADRAQYAHARAVHGWLVSPFPYRGTSDLVAPGFDKNFGQQGLREDAK